MFETVKKKLLDKSARIGVIGLGYVGLPLAVEFAKQGYQTTGFEIDSFKVKSINAGKSYIADVEHAVVKALACDTKIFAATSDFKKLSSMDAVIICVPTPLRKSKDPDVSYIVSATEQVVKRLRKGQLIVLESTTYPGTTRELVLPLLEKTGLRCDKDFFLAFSPERVDPANKRFTIVNTPKVVGGLSEKATKLAAMLYGIIAHAVVPVSSAEAAEMVKLLENTFRAVNIGLVNEVALMCEKLKLDVWEVIDAAASKPFGYMAFYPGPGIGGHCIPLDPHYLSWKLKTLNFNSRFIELAEETNSRMPEYLVRKTSDALNERSKAVHNSKVLILGVAYKKDVNDLRESPALDVIKLLLEKGAKVSYYDPHVPSINVEGKVFKSTSAIRDIAKYDVAIIVTNHSDFDYQFIADNADLLIDSRHATKGIKRTNIVKL